MSHLLSRKNLSSGQVIYIKNEEQIEEYEKAAN
ncbi:MAG: hypothetical protein CM1200mP28_04730 [Deltaproteobacteria bacterium]|nr:MAG: hypothetical protein CM1200mP28_04730 [Deltaproteobacteria bacterium]